MSIMLQSDRYGASLRSKFDGVIGQILNDAFNKRDIRQNQWQIVRKNTLKPYLSKRYFAYFSLLFLLVYFGTLLLVGAHNVTQDAVLGMALQVYFPLLSFVFAFLYFRKSANDWNDRFIVVVGWTLMTIVLSALLVKPMYGYDWSTILNWQSISGMWISMVAMLGGGILQAWLGKK